MRSDNGTADQIQGRGMVGQAGFRSRSRSREPGIEGRAKWGLKHVRGK